MTLSIIGWTPDDKVPGTVTETKYGRGRRSIGSSARKLLLLGNKTTAGSRTVNTGPWQVVSEDDADAQFGAGSELATMCYAALRMQGVEIWALAVTSGVGAAGALTATVGGAWTLAGDITVMIGRWTYSFAAGADVQATAIALAASINSSNRAPWTAAVGAGPGFVVTITMRHHGPRGNYTYAKKELSLAPTGLTLALAGGAAHGDLVPFAAGAGADDITTALTLIGDTQYDKIVCAQNDAVNLALLKTHLATQAGPLIGHLDVAVTGSNDTVGTVTSLANTTLNDYQIECIGSPYQRTAPSEWTAWFGAVRCVTEASMPNYSYDNLVCPVAAPHEKSDNMAHATLKSLLNNGVTPMNTTGVDCKIIRAISTHCLDGTAADYRNLDTSDTAVAIRVTEELRTLADARRAANPVSGPDYPEGENPPEGYDSPALFSAAVYGELKQYERAQPIPWLTQVDQNLPDSEYDTAAHRIMCAINIVAAPLNHQTGISVAQQAL